MRLRERTQAIKASGDKALIPFFTAGYPDEDTFLNLLGAATSLGCSVIEIGIPFSDPMADGPVIQATSQKALAAGMTLNHAIELVATASAENPAAYVFMSYINPIMQMGFAEFSRRAAAAGVAGLIIPDLPVEEAGEIRETLANGGITLVELLAPTSGQTRISQISRKADGFLYLVSITGVTGVKSAEANALTDFIALVKSETDTPLYVGFGVATPAQAADISQLADGVIIGSALIKIINEAAEGKAVEAVKSYLEEIVAAINGANRS